MSSARENRFLDRTGRPRVAVFTSNQFPAPHDMHLLARVQQATASLDADVRCFHNTVAQDLELTPEVDQLLRRSMISPANTLHAEADHDHFERSMPDRMRALDGALRDALGEGEQASGPHVSLRWSFSMARLAQAWRPDVLISFGSHDGSAAASVTHFLTGTPRVMVLNQVPDLNEQGLWTWHAGRTELLVVAGAARDQQFTDYVRNRYPDVEISDVSSPTLPAQIGALVSGAGPATAAQPLFRTVERPPVIEPAASPFLVLGAERTGSNLLVDLLNSHPHIKSYGELFNPALIDEGSIDGLKVEGAELTRLAALRDAAPGDFHAELIARAAERGARHVGFKLLYYHSAIYNRVTDHLTAVPGLRIIHLKRRDRLARWVSHVRAKQSASWYTANSERKQRSAAPLKVRLDLQSTLDDFLWRELQEERAEATFARCPRLEMTYEELAADPADQGARALDFLGADLEELTHKSQKTGSRDARDLVENWDEIADQLRATPWSALAERQV